MTQRGHRRMGVRGIPYPDEVTDTSALAAPPTDGSAPSTPDAPWPVAVLNAKIKGYIDRLGTVWAEGEITQWGVSGGNVYGKLKDLHHDVTLSFNVWSSTRAKFTDDFKQGDRVIALLKPSFWPKGGSLSMQVYELRHVGLGDLLERLERLRNQLAREGLFGLERKVQLPFLPGCIGLITGKDSDAEKDVIRNAQLRWPEVRFRVRHAAVQGDRSAAEVTNAIRELDADPEVDVIIVARGGGDFQNLLTFSDEQLVRAAAACVTPLVSAIGHEADRPPDVADELARVQQARGRMAMRVTALVTSEIDRIGHIRSRPVMADPSWLVDTRAEELTRWVARGAELIDYRLERAGLQVTELAGQLRALSPKRTLERGYAIAQRANGTVLRGAADARAGESLLLTLADGSVPTTVDPAQKPVKSRG
jgi:exodeoxyribonuclease VII large subunit